ncbi:MAG: hypothetical protein GWN01_10310 [Nitrosopumilaceae archaeon]|nr:hypothetical protein [Nitrosopumilaceae archaeon]NIU01291.1 hypothetical protein [Nitrosopumilaceae archaeon]NIU87639.1 hypothetical protein [Nitrosopumilaceae archaeon]NIV66064.1 hypothetical protein [Nitrosopumilaceae archaeon]NIX61893.1 hypothetical protein [Nitrosopumilaceae archaeon]
MDTTKVKFIAVMALAAASVIVMMLANKGFEITTELLVVAVPGAAAAGIIVLLVVKRNAISFLLNVREKPKEIPDEATRRLCGFKKFVAYDDFIIFESENGKLTGHSYIHLSKLPFMIEEMSDDEKLEITRGFSRLLGHVNHPFTYMPICKPVPHVKFMKDLQSKLSNTRVALHLSKIHDPKLQLEEKQLAAQWKRLSQGEMPIEIVFLVQIRASGKTVSEIKQKLSIQSDSMINELSVIHQVMARRLGGIHMVDALHDFFMLEA